jgi:hypothetical protein
VRIYQTYVRISWLLKGRTLNLQQASSTPTRTSGQPHGTLPTRPSENLVRPGSNLDIEDVLNDLDA